MRTVFAALLCCALAGLSRSAAARAEVIVQLRGSGMDEATPVAPIGGNAGTTLGEQRKLALEHAAQLWGERLDSPVPIHVDVVFEPLPCSGSTSVLGAAAAVALFSNISQNGANPEHFYASALANRLAGEDLDPDAAEIIMQLNSDLDGPCLRASGGFYYGFDGRRGNAIDFVETVLHELAHGLGLASFADPETGMLLMGTQVDPFTALVRDLDFDRTWPELSEAERLASAGHVRRVVWDGAAARRSAADRFGTGVPSLELSPAPAAMSGTVSDTSFGLNPAASPAAGDIALAGDAACSALDPAAVSGKVLLLQLSSRCAVGTAAGNAKAAGAVGGLLAVSSPFASPALPFDGVVAPVMLPMLSVSMPDARRIAEAIGAGTVHAELAGRAEQHLGADSEQRPMLFASDPVSSGSSISHVEPLSRPQELMEPITGPVPTHELSFTLAMLADLGWRSGCGDGVVADGEECDDGAGNSDSAPDACRSDCTHARCGDGVRDRAERCDDGSMQDCSHECPGCGNGAMEPGEECDDGARNADGAACRKDCKRSQCGNGMVDSGEACDDGAKNSDTRPDACRRDCQRARCGDGVRDADEQCDEGRDNSDSRADACRSDCRAARCGDGVRDADEQCDEGHDNSDSRADACRSDCRAARCGDSVRDADEQCDDGAHNSDSRADACRSDCRAARCGDGVRDADEACDGTPGCSECRKVGRTMISSQDPAGELPDAGRFEGEDAGMKWIAREQGCGCGVVRARFRFEGAAILLVLASVLRARSRARACVRMR